MSTRRASGLPTAAMRCTVKEKEPRDLRVSCQAEGPRHVERDDGLCGVPHHERLVVVGAVLAVGEECGHSVPALVGRHSLESARNIEPD